MYDRDDLLVTVALTSFSGIVFYLYKLYIRFCDITERYDCLFVLQLQKLLGRIFIIRKKGNQKKAYKDEKRIALARQLSKMTFESARNKVKDKS